jgi:exodeoxyribonuclease V alpha subunit
VLVEGTVRRVRWESPSGSFQVVVLDHADGGPEVVTAVRDAGLRPRERVRVEGRRQLHRGEWQLIASSAERVMPADAPGLVRYLGSGVLPGIGPRLAERIHRHFGEGTLAVLDGAIERLAEVPGITPRRVTELRGAWEQTHGARATLVFLQGLGLTPRVAHRLFRHYGPRAVTVVKENPWRLADEVSGIGFRRADALAQAMGLDPDAPARRMAALRWVLREAGQQGHTCLPRTAWVERAAAALGMEEARVAEAAEASLTADEGVVAVGEASVALARWAEREARLAETLLRRLAAEPDPRLHVDAARVAALEAHTDLRLAPGQREALQQLGAASTSVLTGGPGTGKTTLVRLWLDHLRDRGLRVGLAAPTGRAARRLEESTGSPAMTLHRLLAYDPQEDAWGHDAAHPLGLDALVVDEASMLDTEVADALLDALPPACHLLLVGDVEQLPSVGPGQVLRDILGWGRVPVAALQEVHRQQTRSRIVAAAHAVRAGRSWEAEAEPGGDFFAMRVHDAGRVADVVETLVAERIPDAFGFQAPDDIQVLVPMHAGEAGTEALNQRLQQRFQGEGPSVQRGGTLFRVGDRVMQTRNQYTLEVFNGDIGRVIDVDPSQDRVVVSYEGRPVTYDREALEHLELAYAITVHKSQGSEFEAVVVCLTTRQAPLLQRNLLYTAMTRARRLLVVVAMPRALEMALGSTRDSERWTGLAWRLRSA